MAGPILLTGVAGFIGFHVGQALLNRGETVIGIDNLNPYYDVNLKKARLEALTPKDRFHFYPCDISHPKEMTAVFNLHPSIDRVVHLAAQAGVRYSLDHPYAYGRANLMGHLTMLEAVRAHPVRHFVYASTSSVYGGNKKLPFSVTDPVNTPLSLYAATKRATELMTESYSHLFGVPATGLRFFTVYGPWGRPDMAAFIFTKALLEGLPVPIFNQGQMKRNFTYIDDIVQGVLACLDTPPAGHRVYNLGNDRSENLLDFLQVLENLWGRKAQLDPQAMHPGDVPETLADLTETQRDLGFTPQVSIQEGLKRFVNWYKAFYHVQ